MGEFELLAKLRQRLPATGSRLRVGSGDDAAVTVPGGATATSVDALVEGVHFRREWATLAQIGHKALATALSDLAAMGGEPGEAYVVLGVPADLGEDECLRLVNGLLALAAETGTELAGGDVTRAPVLTLAVTVVGHADAPEQLVTRAGAQAGDALLVSGELGGGAAGLLLLENAPSWPRRWTPRPPSACAGASSNRPRASPPAASSPRPGATAMIDLSDGLGGDAGHLATQSGVALRIDAGALPLAQAWPRSQPPPGSTRSSSRPAAARTTSCWRRYRRSG